MTLSNEYDNSNPELVEAQKLNLAAQARMFDAQAKMYDNDALIKHWEAEQRHAHAVTAQYAAESMRIQTESTQRSEKLSLASNHYHHEFMFNQAVYDDAVEGCLAQLAVWDRLDPHCPMHIILDSPGGSVIDGMHLFDQILAYSQRPWDTSNRPKGLHPTKMTVRGYAASMAGILLQSADERVIGPESYLMIHEVASFAQGKIGELKDEIKFLDRVSDRVADIFVLRSDGKITKKAFIKEWERKDWWLDSQQSFDAGFVDRIG
jgi:ATP-dependent protease ClpP protease subunit